MNSSANAYDALQKQAANYVPLSPLSFLERAAKVYPERAAVVHGERRYGWAETYGRARQLASALAAIGIGAGDPVAAPQEAADTMVSASSGTRAPSFSA